jgi:HAMP domain-containing protein
MRLIECNNCGKRYRLPEELKRKKFTFRCKNCKVFVYVDPIQNRSHSSSPSPKLSSKFQTSRQNFSQSAGEVSSNSPTADLGKKKKTARWTSSIQSKISTVIILITTLVLISFAVFNYFSTKNKLNDELTHFADITTKRLSEYLVESFWALDDKAIADSLRSEMMSRRIYGLLLFDRDGKTVYMGMKRDKDWHVVRTDKIPADGMVTSRMPIRNGKEKIGSIEIFVTKKFMKEDVQRIVGNAAATLLILNTAIFFSILLFLRRIVLKPILNLTHVAKQMSLGDMNVSISIRSNDEIGQLAQAFDRMQTSLSYALIRLKKRGIRAA